MVRCLCGEKANSSARFQAEKGDELLQQQRALRRQARADYRISVWICACSRAPARRLIGRISKILIPLFSVGRYRLRAI
jgi:hypothetical protein